LWAKWTTTAPPCWARPFARPPPITAARAKRICAGISRPRDIFDTGPLGGLSTRGWLRRLDNSQDSNGYDEGWWMVYARAGWFARWHARPDWWLDAEAAARLPLYNSARYSLTGADGDGNVSVEPGREITTEAALILRRPTWSIGLAYENFAFGRSEPEPLPPFEIFQPESKGEAWSLRVGVVF
jgi:hypothetical protein